MGPHQYLKQFFRLKWNCQTKLYLTFQMNWNGFSTLVTANNKLEYSSVPNRCACTFINFEKKIPPARPYFGLHIYWFWKKSSLLVYSILLVYWYWSFTFINFEKKFPLQGLILVCMFNVFLRIFPPAHLFRVTRLFGTLE